MEILKYDTILRLATNVTNTTTGNHVEINGKLRLAVSDERFIEDATIILRVNDQVVNITKTDDDGYYAFDYLTRDIGEITVNVTFEETEIYLGTTANDTFNVTKLPTFTNASVINSTYDHVQLAVNVTDINGNKVPNGTVYVYKKDSTDVIAQNIILNGQTTINVPNLDVGEIYLVVEYQEDVYYLASNATNNTEREHEENITFVNVTKKSSSISIFIDDNNLTIGENVTIRGFVLSEGSLVLTGTVNVTINETVYPTTITGGMYVLSNITSKAGIYDVNATFIGDDETSNITSETLSFTVNKIPTVTTVSIVNSTAGHVMIEVTVTNSTGGLVSGTVNVTFSNGTEIASIAIGGKVNVTIPSVDDSTLEVNVTFLEDDTYLSSVGVDSASSIDNTTVINVEKQTGTISIGLNTTELIIGESVNITGVVMDDEGNAITENVYVTIDGVDYDDVLFLDDGSFSLVNVTVKAGTFTVNATFTGNAKVDAMVSENRSFTVDRIPTVTTVEILNDTVDNVIVDITVEGNNSFIKEGTVTLTVNGKTVTVPLSGETNTTVPLNISVVGTAYVTVGYDGDDIFAPSIGNDTETGKELTDITVSMQQSTITVSVEPNETYVGKTVKINGTLVDGKLNNVDNVYITITVDGVEYPVKVNEGVFSINNVTVANGTIEVVASYDGNSTLNGSTAETNFTVNKIPTVTLVNVTDNRASEVNIEVSVYDNENNIITTGQLEISSSEFETYRVNIDYDVTYLVLNFNTNGTHDVQVKYVENDVYLDSIALKWEQYPEEEAIFDEITVEKMNTTITVTAITPVTVGNTTTVTGRLVDDDEFSIANAVITVTYGEESKTTTTDENGYYQETFKTTSVGTEDVTVTYDGNGTYANSSNTATVEVVQIEATITCTVPEDARANKTSNINGTVIDEFGNPAVGVNVTVTVNGKEYNTTTEDDGTFNVSIDNVVPGKNNVTVSAGNDNITAKDITDKFYVIKEDVNLTVEPISPVLVGDNVTVVGKLLDVDGEAIVGAQVNVTVGDESKVVPVDSEGNYNASFSTSVVAAERVTVTFAGDDKYNSDKVSEIVEVYKITGFIVPEIPREVRTTDEVVISGVVIDEEGNPLVVPVTVIVNDVEYNTTTDEDGVFEVPVDNAVVGLNDVTIIAGNETTDINSVSDKFLVSKVDSSLILDHVSNVLLGDNITIEGVLVDDNDNPIGGADVTVTVDGESTTVQTNHDGTFNATFPTSTLGGKLVTLSYEGNDTYDDATVSGVFTVYEEEIINTRADAINEMIKRAE